MIYRQGRHVIIVFAALHALSYSADRINVLPHGGDGVYDFIALLLTGVHVHQTYNILTGSSHVEMAERVS